jgi:hypothetical protein
MFSFLSLTAKSNGAFEYMKLLAALLKIMQQIILVPFFNIVLVLKISFIFGGRGGEVTLGLLKVT